MQLPSGKFAQVGALTTESPLRDLAAIIRSRIPLIAVESNEEPQIVALVGSHCAAASSAGVYLDRDRRIAAFNGADQPAEIRRQIPGGSAITSSRPSRIACSCCWIFILT